MTIRKAKTGKRVREYITVLDTEEDIATKISIQGIRYRIDDDTEKAKEIERIIRVHNLDPNESEEFKEIINALN